MRLSESERDKKGCHLATLPWPVLGVGEEMTSANCIWQPLLHFSLLLLCMCVSSTLESNYPDEVVGLNVFSSFISWFKY